MADMKEKRKSPLYDRAKPEAEPEKKPAAKEPAAKKAEEPAAGADNEAGEDKGIAKMLEGMKMLHKAHEAERRDLNGNHRDEHRKMAARHEKAIRDMNGQHMEAMGGGEAEGAEPGAEAAAAPAMAPGAAPGGMA